MVWKLLKISDSNLDNNITLKLVYSFAYSVSGYTIWISDLMSVWSQIGDRKSITGSENARRCLIDLDDDDQFEKVFIALDKEIEAGRGRFYVGDDKKAAVLRVDMDNGRFEWQFDLNRSIESGSSDAMNLGTWSEPLFAGLSLRGTIIDNLLNVIHAKDIHLRALSVLVDSGGSRYTPRRDPWALERFDRTKYLQDVGAKRSKSKNAWDLVGQLANESELKIPSSNLVDAAPSIIVKDEQLLASPAKRRRIGDLQREKRGLTPEDEEEGDYVQQESDIENKQPEYLQSPDRRKRIKTVSKNVIGGGGVSKNTIWGQSNKRPIKQQEEQEEQVQDDSVEARRSKLKAQMEEQTGRSRRRRQWL